MKIPFPQEADPLSNLIEFVGKKREPSLKTVRAKYDSCKHVNACVDEEKRQVSCGACGTILDAFQYLWELAIKQRRWLDDLEAWEAMRDSRLSDRYDAQWQRLANAVTQPPEEPETRKVWDSFRAYFGDTFCGMYRRKQRKINGPLWYGKDNRGCMVSHLYVRDQLCLREANLAADAAAKGEANAGSD